MKNLTNMRFGKLVCLKPTNKRKHNSIVWECQCDCGNKVEVRSTSLISKSTKSCGCLYKEINCLPKGVSAFNQLYDKYRRSAKRRKLSFTINKKDFKKLTKQNCHYCGRLPLSITPYKGNGKYQYNGIDRIDNTRGYSLLNCVSCCKECNFMKGTTSVENFIIQAKQIVEYMSR